MAEPLGLALRVTVLLLADEVTDTVALDEKDDETTADEVVCDAEAEEVLLPLDDDVLLPAAFEESVLHDSHGGEELQRNRQQDCERVQELHLDIHLVSCSIPRFDS